MLDLSVNRRCCSVVANRRTDGQQYCWFYDIKFCRADSSSVMVSRGVLSVSSASSLLVSYLERTDFASLLDVLP